MLQQHFPCTRIFTVGPLIVLYFMILYGWVMCAHNAHWLFFSLSLSSSRLLLGVEGRGLNRPVLSVPPLSLVVVFFKSTFFCSVVGNLSRTGLVVGLHRPCCACFHIKRRQMTCLLGSPPVFLSLVGHMLPFSPVISATRTHAGIALDCIALN